MNDKLATVDYQISTIYCIIYINVKIKHFLKIMNDSLPVPDKFMILHQ